jgi:pimeloyl-ACP methyl ester carboxylesterase
MAAAPTKPLNPLRLCPSRFGLPTMWLSTHNIFDLRGLKIYISKIDSVDQAIQPKLIARGMPSMIYEDLVWWQINGDRSTFSPFLSESLMNLRALLIALLFSVLPISASAAPGDIGIVLMHGKQASPSSMMGLAGDLRAAGYRVSTPEMPWSQRRELDVTYPEALAEIEAAAALLIKDGAKSIVVGGHSFGANGALAYAASARPVVGIIALAPGHVPERGNFRRIVAPGVQQARDMIAAGQAQEKTWFPDVNQGKTRQIKTTAAAYFTYFDPDGIAAMPRVAASLTAPMPIFMAVGNSDVISGYAETAIFNAAPKHEKSQYLTLNADHLNTIRIATPQLISWIQSLQ